MKVLLKSLCAGAILLSITGSLRAAITYVDATPNTDGTNGNTTLNGFLINTSTDVTSGSNGTDGKWAYRAVSSVNAANGPGFFESDTSATNGESTLPLVTTISGLTPGQQYKFYVVYWGDLRTDLSSPTNYDIAARVGDSGQFTLFKTKSEPLPVDASAYINGGVGVLTTDNGSEFTNTNPVVNTRAGLTPPNLHLFYSNLGTFTVGENGQFAAYIDGPDVDEGNNPSKRTWYDGLGYELVLPGDFDSDGDVDGADFVAWQTNFPKTSAANQAEGDSDGDGDVDGADFSAWQSSFPAPQASSVAPVPEPSGVVLIVVASMALVIGRASRARSRT
jgi:hypothetical protein